MILFASTRLVSVGDREAVGIDRKTVRKYIERELEAPAYGPRKPEIDSVDPFASYLRKYVKSYPGLTCSRLSGRTIGTYSRSSGPLDPNS